VKQAGGNVTDFKGGNKFLFGKEMVAANSKIYTEFQEIVAQHFAPKKP
jgi:myo-inositol-1(or 4)-monophosphatase